MRRAHGPLAGPETVPMDAASLWDKVRGIHICNKCVCLLLCSINSSHGWEWAQHQRFENRKRAPRKEAWLLLQIASQRARDKKVPKRQSSNCFINCCWSWVVQENPFIRIHFMKGTIWCAPMLLPLFQRFFGWCHLSQCFKGCYFFYLVCSGF